MFKLVFISDSFLYFINILNLAKDLGEKTINYKDKYIIGKGGKNLIVIYLEIILY